MGKAFVTFMIVRNKVGDDMSEIVPSYILTIDEDELNILRENLLNDYAAPAKLMIDQIDYKIRLGYRGAYTRKFRKRSYIVHFKNANNILGAHAIHLNAEYKDPSIMRNKLSLDFFQDLGVLAPDCKHINFFRNETFRGIYLQLESVDDLFLQKRNLPPGPIYYATNNDANFSFERDGRRKRSLLSGMQRANGLLSDDQYLIDLITVINNTHRKDFHYHIQNYINIEKYFNWLVGVVCTMNNDGFNHNYSLYRNSDNGLFEIMPWDYDATWGRKISGGIMDHKYVPIEGKPGNMLKDRLLEIPDFCKIYKEKLEEILETKYTVNYLEDKVAALHDLIRPYYLLDPYINDNIDIFDYEPEMILQFVRNRNLFLKANLKNLY